MKADHLLIADGLNRRVLSEGGGCLSIFGLPFLAAGLFLLLGFLGFVPVKNEDGTPVEMWGRVVFFLMGLAFSCVGCWLVFGRQKIVIDKEQGTLDKEWKVLFSVKKEKKNLRAFKEVALKFERGDSDTSDRYPVVLSGSAEEVSIASPLQFGQARRLALELSEFLHLPFEDRTTEHVKVFMPEGKTEILTAHRPKDMLSRVTETGEFLEILMPQNQGLGCLVPMMLLVPIIFVVEFFPPFHKLLEFNFDIQNLGDIFGIFFFGVFFLFAVFIPLTFVVRALRQWKRPGISIKIDQRTIEIRDLFSQTKIKKIPLDDVISIECEKEKEAKSIAHDKALLGGAKPFQPEFEKRKKAAEKTVAFFSKLGLGRGQNYS